MPYNPEHDELVRKNISHWKDITIRKMFGGVCYSVKGNIFSGVYQDDLILRLGLDEAMNALSRDHVKPFDITGKPMKGWVMIEKPQFDKKEKLINWLIKAHEFALTLPAK